MNNKLSFRKTPLALAIAGLTLSMGVQADSAFQYGRWAGGGSTGPGACTAGIGAGACNQDETNVQRVLAAVAGEVPVVPPVVPPVVTPEEVPDGEWVIYAAGNRQVESDEWETGRGTLVLAPNDDGSEGGTIEFVGVFTDTEAFFAGNFEDTGDRVPFTGTNSEQKGSIRSSIQFIPNFDTTDLDNNDDNDFADGRWSGEGPFGNVCCPFDETGEFVAGQPTLFSDMASLSAGNVSAEYGGFAPNTGYDVSFDVNFGPGTFHADFTEGFVELGSFDADGVINGADFSSTQIDSGAGTGFVDGTFFGGNGTDGPDALGGHFDVTGEGGESAADIFGAVKGQDPGSIER